MPSTNKLTHHRRSDPNRVRPLKAGVRALNRDIRAQVDREHELMQLLAADAQLRDALMTVPARPADPLAVWWDFEQFRDYTNVGAEQLPRWEDIGEYLKVHLVLRASLIFGGFAFTARVRPTLEARWRGSGRLPGERIHKLIANAASERKLHEPFCYVIEGKSRKGSRTGLHIHGVMQTDNPFMATRLLQVLEDSISAGSKGKVHAGFRPRSGAPILIEQVYEKGMPSAGTAGRWAQYITKNAVLPDARIGPKRVYISNNARALAKELWAFMRGDVPD